MSKHWTPEEIEYLEESWGNRSIQAIADKLGRSFAAVQLKSRSMNLGSSRLGGDGIGLAQFAIAIGVDAKTIRERWIGQYGLKTKKIKLTQRTLRKIKLDIFWPWAEKNKLILNFARFEPGALGKEPDWVAEKRRADQLDPSKKNWNRPWTADEEQMLIAHTKSCKYTYQDLAKAFNRTEKAILRRLGKLGVPYRPNYQDCHVKWTQDEINSMHELRSKGYSNAAIASVIGKSQCSISNRMIQR